MKIENIKNKWDVFELVKNKGVVGLNQAISANKSVVGPIKKEVCRKFKNKSGVRRVVKGNFGGVDDL